MNPLNWPLWARSQLVGFFYACVMYIAIVDGPRTVLQIALFPIAGALCGLALWAAFHRQERRLYGDLTAAERETAVAAVRAGLPPGDPRLAAVATRVATGWAGRYRHPGVQLGIFGFFFLLCGYLAVTGTLWAWIGLVFWPLICWYSMRMERRQRDAGRRYLAAAGAA